PDRLIPRARGGKGRRGGGFCHAACVDKWLTVRLRNCSFSCATMRNGRSYLAQSFSLVNRGARGIAGGGDRPTRSCDYWILTPAQTTASYDGNSRILLTLGSKTAASCFSSLTRCSFTRKMGSEV